MFSDPRTAGLCPRRLVAAVHEMGHLAAFLAIGPTIGIRVTRIKVWGHGRTAAGMTTIDGSEDPRTASAAYVRGRLVCALAGEIAERTWLQAHGEKFRARVCAGDRKIYRYIHRRSRFRIPREDIRRETTALVTANWNTITGTAPLLAQDGLLTLETISTLAEATDTAAEPFRTA